MRALMRRVSDARAMSGSAIDRAHEQQRAYANALRLPDRVLVSSPQTAEQIPGAVLVDISEFQQADGGLTCLSILL